MLTCLAPNGPTVYRSQTAPTQLLIGTADGVVTIERTSPGAPWRKAWHALEGQHISSLMVEPRRGGVFAGVHGGKLHASADGGRTFQPRMRGITHEHVYTLASVERDGQVVLYAGTEPAHLFESTDHGETWRELPALRDVPGTERWSFPAPPHLAHVKDISFDPRDARTMYVAIEQGALLRSTDGGQSFHEITAWAQKDDFVDRDAHRIALRASNPDEIYLSSGVGLTYSADRGATWERLTGTTMRIGYPDGMLLSPLDDRVVYMCGSITNPGQWMATHDADAAIGRSRDGGRTWEELRAGLPAHIKANFEAMSVAAWPGGFALFTGTTSGDVFASEDGGERWEQIASGLSPISKTLHYMMLS